MHLLLMLFLGWVVLSFTLGSAIGYVLWWCGDGIDSAIDEAGDVG